MDCVICGNIGIYKIRGQNIYYCKSHYEQFFSKNCLENIEKIEIGEKEAQILKKLIEN